MIIEKIDKHTVNLISEQMSRDLIKHPLFMYFCSDISKRADFIGDYFKYYIPRWVKNDVLFVNDKNTAAIVLTDPKSFEYKYKGINAYRMKKYSFSSTVFVHRENLETICDILLPESRESRIMTVYAGIHTETLDVLKLADEAMAYARDNNLILAYDTFSRVFQPSFERKGFVSAYSKQFMNTRFSETVMIYNM